MKNFKNIIPLLFIACTFVACESRVDWFEKNNSPAQIALQEIGNEQSNPSNVIEVSFRYGESIDILYNISDEVYSTSMNTFYMKDNYDGKIEVSQDIWSKTISIKSLLNKCEQDSNTYTFNVMLYTKDFYGVESSAEIIVKQSPNLPPKPNLKYTSLKGDGIDPKYEYEFSTEGSYDSDGDDIVAYEYLFDGIIRKSDYIFMYETDKEGNEITNHLPGNAAYGGTYIYATKLSAVKHAFQSTGNHTVHIRCKDSQGCWSEWKEWKITIKD